MPARRQAILGYFEYGPNLVTLAKNGWVELGDDLTRSRSAPLTPSGDRPVA